MLSLVVLVLVLFFLAIPFAFGAVELEGIKTPEDIGKAVGQFFKFYTSVAKSTTESLK
ncbi:MAG: hypothetical protein ACRD38_12640 [Nitrososphaerales archaeon]